MSFLNIARRCMVTTVEKVTKVVAASIQEMADLGSGLVKVSFLIPAFKSQYPIPVRVPKEEADALEPGYDYTIMLEQERLKEGKSGRYQTDYWWGWRGLAHPDAIGKNPKPIEVSVSGPVAEQPRPRDDTRVSIERQKALDIAERAYQWYMGLHPFGKPTLFKEMARHITQAAKVFADYLETGRPIPEEGSKES